MIVDIDTPVTLTLKIGRSEAITIYFVSEDEKLAFVLALQELHQELARLRQS